MEKLLSINASVKHPRFKCCWLTNLIFLRIHLSILASTISNWIEINLIKVIANQISYKNCDRKIIYHNGHETQWETKKKKEFVKCLYHWLDIDDAYLGALVPYCLINYITDLHNPIPCTVKLISFLPQTKQTTTRNYNLQSKYRCIWKS